ncbi:hypothetical protein GCM10022223_18170 [Kineosporia mesophila]|uniref:Asp23/Gls24 family envelope stress response protein n=1 Tax=Kineosporia mesophila TaxID=566012 RepID=A0ABP6Z9D7_9ACTN|nr:hypothetical protein [Kineosporia mesophila]MCD5351946.1 hypothetical protein [Kineosporia mesophila]
MTTHEPTQEPRRADAASGSPANTQTLIDLASRALTEHADQRWVEVAPRVLSTALRATRRSLPVRAHAPGGTVHVSEQVIVAYLHDALDGHTPGTAVAGIHVNIAGQDTFTGVLIELIVQYGTAILPAADRIRAQAATVLLELLGPAATAINVQTSHIHVSDITTQDPQEAPPTTQPGPSVVNRPTDSAARE